MNTRKKGVKHAGDNDIMFSPIYSYMFVLVICNIVHLYVCKNDRKIIFST